MDALNSTPDQSSAMLNIDYRTMKLLRATCLGLVCLFVSCLAGCKSYGPGRVSSDRFDYNEAIARSRDEQMLLNIVRIRYLRMPDFLSVSSVIASYSYSGGLGAGGAYGFDNAPDVISGNANIGYSERPTITYTPLAGQEFSRRLLKAIPIDVMFSLGQAGWPTDILFSIALQRMNDVKNMSFGQVPAPGDVDREQQFERERQKLVRFQRLLQLIIVLDNRGLIEVLRSGDEPQSAPYLHIAGAPPEESKGLLEEFKGMLGLAAGESRFLITGHTTDRNPNEITIRTRSLLAIISFLSRGIDVPEDDRESGRVIVMPLAVRKEIVSRVPLRIHSSRERPEDPYCSIHFRDHWFYIDNSDTKSKRTFATMLVLFQLQAPSGGSAAPLLTLPTGD